MKDLDLLDHDELLELAEDLQNQVNYYESAYNFGAQVGRLNELENQNARLLGIIKAYFSGQVEVAKSLYVIHDENTK